MVAINRERVIQTLVDLCALRSPSFEEGPVRTYVRSALEALAIPVSEDSHGNVYARIEGAPDLEPLFLCSHMDTVPVPADTAVTVCRSAERITSDGTTILGGDDKQGIAAALEMARLAATHPRRNRGMDLLFTVEEEVGSLGGGNVEPGRVCATQGYNLDGETPPGTAVNRAPRKARYTATVRGRSTHAALDPEGGINAIAVAAAIISRLPLGAPNEHSTSNVGTIAGGRQTNVVPGEATFTGEIRSFDADAFEALRNETDSIAARVAADAGAAVSIAWEETYDRYEVGPAEPCVEWFDAACRAAGIEPRLVTSRGGGDANQLNRKGLRCIVFGLGMHAIHSVDEYVLEEEYLTAVELLASIVFAKEVTGR